jgi:hypothetical protein
VTGSLTLRTATAPPAPTPFARVQVKEVVLVFTGGRACCDSLTPVLRGPIESIKKSVAAQAKQSGADFRANGVSIDSSLQDGLSYLKQFGDFDTAGIMPQGRGEFSRRPIPRPPVPQVVVYVHEVEETAPTVRFGPQLVLKRLTTAKEIIAWAHAGAPLP